MEGGRGFLKLIIRPSTMLEGETRMVANKCGNDPSQMDLEICGAVCFCLCIIANPHGSSLPH
jgi:hypothetical protein